MEKDSRQDLPPHYGHKMVSTVTKVGIGVAL